ncbi:MAG TPA: alpha/beta hydrolase [Lamprocystis sp. (in: g-proteobacteria)]|nr:alpha/beta hydrolase [Lamprocystis sp. (in: g-proteobacteria)]
MNQVVNHHRGRAGDLSPDIGRGTTLFVPGYRGSGAGHWQTWMETQVPGARRVSGIDWDTPVAAVWAAAIRREIAHAPAPVWLVAHSFGCLAAVLAGSAQPERVAGALLVAPADPERFSPTGQCGAAEAAGPSPGGLTPFIPKSPLGFPSLVIGSRNDPWMALPRVCRWARRWGGEFVDLGKAGHVNPDSGFGPWPEGLDLLHALQVPRGRQSLLAIRARGLRGSLGR